jgi:hypothetical protein
MARELTPRAGRVEFDILCLSTRPHPDPERIVALLRRGVDADYIVALAAQHGVRPGLVQSLSEIPSDLVPAPLRDALAAFKRGHLAWALGVSNELLAVAAAFSGAGIAFAAFKGPVLALHLYGDLARRECSDIDFIVPPSQVEAAERILAEMGYRNVQGDRAFREAFLRHQRQYSFVRQGFDTAIDLHWDFTADPLPFPLGVEEIWSGLSSVAIGGRSVPTFAGEELALLLAGHGTKEAWRSLGWICDFAMLVDRLPDLDWPRIHARARRHGCGDSVLLACAMAQALFETPVPPALVRAVDANERVRRLAAELVARLRSTLPDEVPRETLEDALLCDRWRDRLWAGLKLALTPTPSDYQALPLPRPLWLLYWASRPVRLAAGIFARGGAAT